MLFRCGSYLRSACCKQSFGLARYFSSKVKDPNVLTMSQKRELEAQQWFEGLSPEMKLKKKKVENEVHLLKEKGIYFDYEVTSADIKYIMTECPSYSSMRKYLVFKQRTMYSKLADQEKKRKKREAKEKMRADEGPIDVNNYAVYSYTRAHYYQSERYSVHRAAMTVMNSPSPIVFDMDFDVSKREEMRALEQIEFANGMNKYFPEPCNIHVTSALKNGFLKEKLDLGFAETKSNFMDIHKEGFEEVFPLDKLVYLSPDAPPLMTHTPGDIYVIGGLVDLKDTTSLRSLRKAQRLNIRCGSIPFVRYGLNPSQLKASTRYVLTLNAVFEILLNLNLKHQWKYVMNDIKKNNILKRPIPGQPDRGKRLQERTSKNRGFI